MPEAEQAEREFGVVRRWWQFSPSFNVGPSRYVPSSACMTARSKASCCAGASSRTGPKPTPAKACAATRSIASVEHAPATRGAWEVGRRCIVPMFGFYMWQPTWQGHRQPFFVRLVNRPVFGVAAVWDRTEAEDGDDVIEGCALITVPPNPLLAELQGSATADARDPRSPRLRGLADRRRRPSRGRCSSRSRRSR